MTILAIHILICCFFLLLLISPTGYRYSFRINDNPLYFKTYMLKPKSWLHFLYLRPNNYRYFPHVKQTAALVISFWVYFIINTVLTSLLAYYETINVFILGLQVTTIVLEVGFVLLFIILLAIIYHTSTLLSSKYYKELTHKEKEKLDEDILKFVPTYYDLPRRFKESEKDKQRYLEAEQQPNTIPSRPFKKIRINTLQYVLSSLFIDLLALIISLAFVITAALDPAQWCAFMVPIYCWVFALSINLIAGLYYALCPYYIEDKGDSYFIKKYQKTYLIKKDDIYYVSFYSCFFLKGILTSLTQYGPFSCIIRYKDTKGKKKEVNFVCTKRAVKIIYPRTKIMHHEEYYI